MYFFNKFYIFIVKFFFTIYLKFYLYSSICITMNNDETEVNDVNQDIARSAFADMILDHDRNQRYKIGLGFVIEEKHLLGDVANVVDIGIIFI